MAWFCSVSLIGVITLIFIVEFLKISIVFVKLLRRSEGVGALVNHHPV